MDNPESMSYFEFDDEEETSEEDQEHGDEGEEGKVVTNTSLLESAGEITVEKCLEGSSNSEEEFDGLSNQILSLEDRQNAIESEFYNYCSMKEQESTFQKLQIMCLGLKLELLESQNHRLEGTIEEFRGVTEKVDGMRKEIKWLKRKSKKLNRKNRECLRLVQSNEEFYRATQEIKEVADKLHSGIKAIEKKIETHIPKQQMEDMKLFEQSQHLRDQWSVDMEELIYIGWINAALRREIIMIEEADEENYDDGDDYDEEAKPGTDTGGEVVMEFPHYEHVENCNIEFYDAMTRSSTTPEVAGSKSSGKPKNTRLLHKLKGWAIKKGNCKRACMRGKV